VNAGEIRLGSCATAAVIEQFSTGARRRGRGRDRNPLFTREREIVSLVAQGYTNKEMPKKTFIRNFHKIFAELGFSDRSERALCGIQGGLHLI
jgi:DNA-binding NarL/FixJ family response regulator